MAQTPRIFIAYSREDAHLLEKLRKPLNVLRRNGHCEIFFDGEIVAGERWDERLKDELHKADIYLLLVSDDFLDSDYINDVELPKALEKEREGKAKVVPIILRPCMWQYTLLKEFQVVLHDGKPIEISGGYVHAVEQVARVIEGRNETLRLEREALEQRIEAQRRKAEQARLDKEAEDKRRREAEAARLKAEEEERRRQAEEDKRLRAAEERRRSLDPFHDLMVHIPGGTFDMGDTFGEGYDSEKPVHKVTVPDFYLCKCPVTQATWKKIMGDGNNPSHFKGDDLPVEKVSWNDAQDFIKKLNEKTSKNYRLPSEAEWEYAAREGGKKVRFGNGKDIADSKEINFNGSAAYKKPYSEAGEYRGKTTPVGSLNCPNSFGLHDMSGNVWEWCEDVWHENYKGAPDDGSAWTKGGDQVRRVVRGGSWVNFPDLCRAAYRSRNNEDNRGISIGFRLAR